MAKGNLFLGTAAKSVGDVVMYRREGSQVSRVRVRKIANPKTDAQCRQRAYMAPIPKFFSPLAIVLERSFEGLSKSKSYSKFLKVNADKARANDWLLPKGIGFFPLPYTLSQGSLPVMGYTVSNGGPGLQPLGLGLTTTPSTIGELSIGFINAGYSAGDVVTIIIISSSSQTDPDNFVPVAYQFEINTTSSTTIADAFPSLTFAATPDGIGINPKSGFIQGAAIIIARFENEKWRRSTQSLVIDSHITQMISAADYKATAIASYSNTAGEPNPLVYLDGDELQ